MSNEVKVSVLCITYNQKDYISDALDSFINQKTNFKYEILVNDDCSTDGTKDIVIEYAKRYPDIIKPIFHEENQYSKGVSPIRDVLIPKAVGKYIAICEGMIIGLITISCRYNMILWKNIQNAAYVYIMLFWLILKRKLLEK